MLTTTKSKTSDLKEHLIPKPSGQPPVKTSAVDSFEIEIPKDEDDTVPLKIKIKAGCTIALRLCGNLAGPAIIKVILTDIERKYKIDSAKVLTTLTALKWAIAANKPINTIFVNLRHVTTALLKEEKHGKKAPVEKFNFDYSILEQIMQTYPRAFSNLSSNNSLYLNLELFTLQKPVDCLTKASAWTTLYTSGINKSLGAYFLFSDITEWLGIVLSVGALFGYGRSFSARDKQKGYRQCSRVAELQERYPEAVKFWLMRDPDFQDFQAQKPLIFKFPLRLNARTTYIIQNLIYCILSGTFTFYYQKRFFTEIMPKIICYTMPNWASSTLAAFFSIFSIRFSQVSRISEVRNGLFGQEAKMIPLGHWLQDEETKRVLKQRADIREAIITIYQDNTQSKVGSAEINHNCGYYFGAGNSGVAWLTDVSSWTYALFTILMHEIIGHFTDEESLPNWLPYTLITLCALSSFIGNQFSLQFKAIKGPMEASRYWDALPCMSSNKRGRKDTSPEPSPVSSPSPISDV